MTESDLKCLIKEVVRECVKEACDGGKLAGGEKGKRMFKHVKAGYKGEKAPEDAKRIAAATVNKQLGKEEKAQKGTDVKKAMKLNPSIVKGGDKGKMQMGAKPSMLKKEAGAISEYDESEEQKLIRGLHLITKKLLGMHKGMDTEKHEEEEHGEKNEKPVKENGPQYKVRDGRSYVEQPGQVDRAREIQEDPLVNEDEGQYKVRDGKSQVEQPGKVNRALRIQKDPKIAESTKKSVKCKKCGKSFVPSYGEYSRCPDCLGKEHSAAEKATGVEENYVVQHRSAKTIKDLENDPNNVRDPEVPQA